MGEGFRLGETSIWGRLCRGRREERGFFYGLFFRETFAHNSEEINLKLCVGYINIYLKLIKKWFFDVY